MVDPKARGRFPDGFLLGAATSAFQIEGSPLEDGAGESNWYRFTHEPGRTRDHGDIACDHYHRSSEDVAIMAEIGLDAYRFSLSWSRILPDGRGRPNPRGLEFYDRLIDQLLERKIKPFVTLFHWDLPAVLDERGGWLHGDMANWFADYARIAFRRFGDRVGHWATLNEPWVVCDAGFLNGVHAPGHSSPADAAVAARHLLLAHGRAVQAYRAESEGQIGLVVNLEPKEAASDSPEDLAATQREDAYFNRQFLDPVLLGSVPDELPAMWGADWPVASADDMRTISEPVDFVGINYYSRSIMRADDDVVLTRARAVPQTQSLRTEVGWEVYPAGLLSTLRWFRGRYGDLPLFITENGAAFADPERSGDEPMEDPLRVSYLREHLRAARTAIEEGIDLRGYFAWSLLDNLEWTHGFSKRFGLIHVDFDSLQRSWKQSARFYREVIESRGECL
jgi:beta-glucosidase